jgi:hypothetical protein
MYTCAHGLADFRESEVLEQSLQSRRERLYWGVILAFGVGCSVHMTVP